MARSKWWLYVAAGALIAAVSIVQSCNGKQGQEEQQKTTKPSAMDQLTKKCWEVDPYWHQDSGWKVTCKFYEEGRGMIGSYIVRTTGKTLDEACKEALTDIEAKYP